MLHTEPIVLPPADVPGEPVGPNDRDSLDIDAIVRFVRRRWRLWVNWMVGGLCVGIAFAALSPAYYTAHAIILLEGPASNPIAAATGGADAAVTAYIDSQIQILQSDEVVGRVVAQNRLTTDKEFGTTAIGLRARILSLFGLGRATMKLAPQYLTTLHVQAALSVRRVGVSDAVEIGFTSRDPQRSAAIANAMVKSYIDGRLEQKRQAREDAAAYLRKRLAELRDKAFVSEPPQEPLPGIQESAAQVRARFREMQYSTEAYRVLYNHALEQAYGDLDSQFSSNVRVITPAVPPLGKSWPRPIHIIGIIVVAAVIGVGHALAREATDHTFGTVEDVQRATGPYSIVGVPKIEGQAWKTGEARPGDLQPAYLRASAALCEAMGRVAIRMQEGQNRRSGLVIGVAAPGNGAGASSIAAHLARVIAESGQKTLLVDANWRKPSMPPTMLNSTPGRTLARGLAAIPLESEKLDILVLRATAPIPELNASLSILTTLQHLPTEYDWVVVDFHSAEQSAELEASMTVINAVLVVAEARRTTSQSLDGLLRVLPGDKVAAVILNKV